MTARAVAPLPPPVPNVAHPDVDAPLEMYELNPAVPSPPLRSLDIRSFPFSANDLGKAARRVTERASLYADKQSIVSPVCTGDWPRAFGVTESGKALPFPIQVSVYDKPFEDKTHFRIQGNRRIRWKCFDVNLPLLILLYGGDGGET